MYMLTLTHRVEIIDVAPEGESSDNITDSVHPSNMEVWQSDRMTSTLQMHNIV